MHIQFKGKGGLVLVYLVVCLIVLLMAVKGVEALFETKFNTKVYLLFAGIAFVAAGFWIFFTADDYVVDDEGNIHYMNFDHQFFFIKMKYWSYIFWGIGGLIVLETIAEILHL